MQILKANIGIFAPRWEFNHVSFTLQKRLYRGLSVINILVNVLSTYNRVASNIRMLKSCHTWEAFPRRSKKSRMPICPPWKRNHRRCNAVATQCHGPWTLRDRIKSRATSRTLKKLKLLSHQAALSSSLKFRAPWDRREISVCMTINQPNKIVYMEW